MLPSSRCIYHVKMKPCSMTQQLSTVYRYCTLRHPRRHVKSKHERASPSAHDDTHCCGALAIVHYPLWGVPKPHTCVEAISFQGKIMMPINELMMPAALKVILSGARLTSALAGATTFAAMFVLSVATTRPASHACTAFCKNFDMATVHGLQSQRTSCT